MAPPGSSQGARTNPPGSSSSLAGLPPIQRLIGRENWTTWKYAVKMYLVHEELWEVVQPTPKEDGTLPEVDRKLDQKTLSKIAMLVDHENYVHIQEAETGDVWRSRTGTEGWSAVQAHQHEACDLQ